MDCNAMPHAGDAEAEVCHTRAAASERGKGGCGTYIRQGGEAGSQHTSGKRSAPRVSKFFAGRGGQRHGKGESPVHVKTGEFQSSNPGSQLADLPRPTKSPPC